MNNQPRGLNGSRSSDSDNGLHENASLFNASLDGAFGKLSLFNFARHGQDGGSIYSPQPFLKSVDTCRLTEATSKPFSGGFHHNNRYERMPAWYDTPVTMNDITNLSSTIQDESFVNAANTSFVGNIFSNVRSTRLLPSWAVDLSGNLRPDLTLSEVIDKGALVDFAMDRNGAKFLEENYPEDAENTTHRQLFDKMLEHKNVFMALCRSASGNFIMQKMVACAVVQEQQRLVSMMRDDLLTICLDKFACRVAQSAVQRFDLSVASQLARELRNLDIVKLCTDQNGNHVIQKVIKSLPIDEWEFVVKFLCQDDKLMSVCQDKYGCRIVQQTIEKLSDNPRTACFKTRLQLLHSLMASVARNCGKLSSNEFANYVVQHVVKSSGVMEVYRDTIIEKCLLRNLLSMSQDKYASHVVEGAFLFAPWRLLNEMMDEIFDGYVRDQDTNRDALDILLFHQYGNYIVQQMIHICSSALLGQEERKLTAEEFRTYEKWLDRVKDRVARHATRLERFSSGKKIMESLLKLSNIHMPLFAPPPPMSQLPTIPTAPIRTGGIWAPTTSLLDLNTFNSVFLD